MIAISIISSRQPKTLTKRIQLDANGQLKKSTVANMGEGGIQSGTVDNATEFADKLQALEHNQALVFGVPNGCDPYGSEPQQCQLLSRAKFEQRGQPDNAITRTKGAFAWPAGAGVLLVDYDPPHGKPPMSRQQLLAALSEVVPELASCAHVWWCSSSSLIFNTETQEQLAGIKGQRLYIMVQDARDIERAGAVLFSRLWLAGYGHYEVSRAGSALERSIVDASVWQPTRLDFAAGASCVEPLEQRRGAPQVQEGELLDTTSALPNLTDGEEADLKAAKNKARELVQDDIEATRQLYIEETARALVGDKLTGDELDAALEQAHQTVSRACQQQVLAGDFTITLVDGQSVTVAEVLDSPAEFHGKQTLDPLEPEYNEHKVCGKLYLIGGRPNLYSQAHGGRNFRLIRQPSRIEHRQGHTADCTATTLELLRKLPEAYDKGSELVIVQDGKAHRLERDGLAFWLGGVAQYWTWKQTLQAIPCEKQLDPPPLVLNQLLALQQRRQLKPLKAVISAPVINTDGQLLARVGYDSASQLYLDMTEAPPVVPDDPTPEHVDQALREFMAPFANFPTVTAQDRSVLLCAALTAILRPALPTAPGFGLDAPAQGTGKTYLAKCLGALATGEEPTVYPHTRGRDDEETRKRITAILAGGEQVIVWDNVLGHFDSAAMAALFTSETYSDRILGESRISTVPNRALTLFTGNNLALAGDMPRRVLKCRLDAKVANPALRKFDGNPLADIQRNRKELVRAGLTLVRAYLKSPEHTFNDGVTEDTTASFEDWDRLCRQPVAWLAKERPEYADPGEALKEAVNNDPEVEALAEMLAGVERVMGNGWWQTRELFKRIDEPYAGFAGKNDAGERAELADTLTDISGNHKLTSRGLGRLLGYRVDRIAGGRVLVKRKTDRALYKVEAA